MKIERAFTEPGRDAYEAIEFRTATSEIRNPDGSVVFRLDAIEVPAAWSQVAVDVLAQKYFRKAGVRARLRPVVADVRAVLRGGAGPGILGLSVVTLAGYLATFVVAARAVGATAPVTELLPLLVLALLVMALPFNVGGWGPREAVAAVGFAAVGLGAAQGFSAAVAYGVLCMVACLPGGAVLLLRVTGARRPHEAREHRASLLRGRQ